MPPPPTFPPRPLVFIPDLSDLTQLRVSRARLSSFTEPFLVTASLSSPVSPPFVFFDLSKPFGTPSPPPPFLLCRVGTTRAPTVCPAGPRKLTFSCRRLNPRPRDIAMSTWPSRLQYSDLTAKYYALCHLSNEENFMAQNIHGMSAVMATAGIWGKPRGTCI